MMRPRLIWIPLALAVPGILAWCAARRMAHNPRHAVFAKGTVPDPLPDGPYAGRLLDYAGLAGPWLGKRFDVTTSSGMNQFRALDRAGEIWRFKTYVAPGLQDPSQDVLRIDYRLPENPFWSRAYVDDLVQVRPGYYLGKAYLALVPGRPLPLLFFELRGTQRRTSCG